jgi:glutaredoxin-related protein
MSIQGRIRDHVNGEFVGGCDIMPEIYSAELKPLLDKAIA